MLVYANKFELAGENPTLQILRALSGWFSEKLEKRVPVNEVVWEGERSGGKPNCWLRTDSAEGEGFKLYSWVLKHPDTAIAGRQWVTELGLKENENGVSEFSCVVYTEEQSTIISQPVQASRPRIVKFIFENVNSESSVSFASGTVGINIKNVGESTESYRGLLSEIEKSDRSFPIVIVSPTNNGNFLVEPHKLQKTLFGLAQVVSVDPSFNSYEMEEVLGRNYAAWAGAINIIRVPHRDGRVFNHLIQERDIPVECDNSHKRECFVLGRVSHNTNIPLQRNRVRPEGVRNLAAQNRIKQRVERMLEVDRGEEVKEELKMVYEELAQLGDELAKSQDAKEGLELTLIEVEDRAQDLDKQLRTKRFYSQDRGDSSAQSIDESAIIEILKVATSNSEPTPKECLELIQAVFPEKVVVLDSAFESAHEVSNFQQGKRLLDMLVRLITQYLPAFLSGGDNEARDCFTNNEFSARESDTVSSNKELMRHRQFDMGSDLIEMSKHLRIGVADDATRTIRVHFEVLRSCEKIAIGHCGAHLPLLGR